MTESTGGAVTLRELYAQTETVRKTLEADIHGLDTKLTGKIEQLQAHVEASLVAHRAEHKEHDTQHVTEYAKRSSLIRWAVTTVLSGIGVLAALTFGIIAWLD